MVILWGHNRGDEGAEPLEQNNNVALLGSRERGEHGNNMSACLYYGRQGWLVVQQPA